MNVTSTTPALQQYNSSSDLGNYYFLGEVTDAIDCTVDLETGMGVGWLENQVTQLLNIYIKN